MQGTTRGWWMHPGPAICPYCEHPHQIEAMLYCGGCDGAVCAVCVVMIVANVDPLCPRCHALPAGEG